MDSLPPKGDALRLPLGWESKRLGEVCIVERGSSPRPIKKYFTDSSDGVNWIKIGDTKNISKYLYETKQKISQEGSKKSRYVKEGDFILSNSMSFGQPYIMKTDGYIHDGWFVLRLPCYIDSDYFFLLLSSPFVQKQFINLSSGAIVKNISGDLVKKTILPIPPLSKQKRIVKILDKAFVAIDKAKQNAEQNLINAKEVFESYLQGVFESNKWEKVKIESLSKVTGGYSFKSKCFKKEGKYQVIRMGNVRPGIIRENESPVFLDDVGEKVLQRALLKRNDVIITQTGTKKKRDYGFTVIIEKDNYLLNQRISSIRFDNRYLADFFLYYSWTNFFKDQYFANETGTVGQGNVGIKAILEALIPYPEIEIQQKTVINIKYFLSKTKKLESIYQQKLENLAELKKSILQKAFRGEL